LPENTDGLEKISVNNGGDIAIWLADGETSVVGVADPVCGRILARASINSTDLVGGIATSGRHGRSLSLGIADSVTILAKSAVMADAAATLIANAVNLSDNAKVQRVLAETLDPDSDLEGQWVTVGVSALSSTECSNALQAGLKLAEQLKRRKLILNACLFLQGHCLATNAFEAVARIPSKQTANRSHIKA